MDQQSQSQATSTGIVNNDGGSGRVANASTTMSNLAPPPPSAASLSPTRHKLQQIQSQSERLRSRIQTQLQSDNVQKRKQQAMAGLQNFGTQLQKLNLGKLIDQMESDQGLADSLEQLNDRMKEEVERQEVRREAEAAGLKVVQDHLDETLAKNPKVTYEDWITELHPENANQGKLLSDIQEIDARFYVFQSDHRRLWNEAMDKLQQDGDETAIHRRIEPRTTKWGDQMGGGGGTTIDLISGSTEFKPNTTTAQTNSNGFQDNPPSTDDNDEDGGGFVDVDVFGPPRRTSPTTVDPFSPSAPDSLFHDPFAPVTTTSRTVTTAPGTNSNESTGDNTMNRVNNNLTTAQTTMMKSEEDLIKF